MGIVKFKNGHSAISTKHIFSWNIYSQNKIQERSDNPRMRKDNNVFIIFCFQLLQKCANSLRKLGSALSAKLHIAVFIPRNAFTTRNYTQGLPRNISHVDFTQ